MSQVKCDDLQRWNSISEPDRFQNWDESESAHIDGGGDLET